MTLLIRAALAVAAAALAGACAAAPTGTPASATSPARTWDAVSFTMNSWGQPLTAWTVNADGSGTWSESTPRNGNFTDRETTTRALAADASAAAALTAILAALPATPPTGDNCKERITDQPYGALTVTIGGRTKEYRYDAGCLDVGYVRFLNRLRAADELVAARGRAG
jgi:hypothetical protein